MSDLLFIELIRQLAFYSGVVFICSILLFSIYFFSRICIEVGLRIYRVQKTMVLFVRNYRIFKEYMEYKDYFDSMVLYGGLKNQKPILMKTDYGLLIFNNYDDENRDEVMKIIDNLKPQLTK